MSSPVFADSQQHAAVSGLPAVAKAPAPITYSWMWATALFIVDITLFVLSAIFANELAVRVYHTPPHSRVILGDVIMVTLWILMFRALGLYRKTYAFRMRDELYYTVAALSLGALPQLVIFTIVPEISTSRVGVLLALSLSIPIVGAGRTIMHRIHNMEIFKDHGRFSIVGTPARVHEALTSLALNPRATPMLIEVDEIDDMLSGCNGDLESIPWFASVVQGRCHTIIFTEMVNPKFLPRILDVSARYHIRVAFAPPRIKRHAFSLSLETNGNQALIVATQLNACTPAARLTKRIMDVVLGTLAIVVFLPVMLMCTVAIYLESGGPILYRQRRVGMNGKCFDILKFRSMKVDAESQVGAVWVRENDDRRTRVGAIMRRLSFDELPQFFNVLRGDMSLVGPRPERPIFVEKFRQVFPRYDERNLVQPGITGWSHVMMRRLVTTDDMAQRLQYDLGYIEQWSVWLDISILFKTAVEFLFQRAA